MGSISKCRRGLTIADLHHGSSYGMLPPNFIDSDDREVAQNIGQKYLWQCWTDMTEHAADGGPIDFLVVNGDAIDGEQRKQHGTELCLPRLADQSEAAIQSLTFLIDKIKPAKIYVVSGTPYHDSEAGREAEVVAERIGAERYPGLSAGRYCRDMLDLNVDGVVVNCMHGIPSSGALYRGVSPDREALWSAVAGKEGKALKADCLVRSHVHHFVHVEHPSKHIFVTPCWQLQTGFMRKSSAFRFMPDIGYAIIEIDPEAKKRKEDPCQIRKRCYPLPEPRAAKF